MQSKCSYKPKTTKTNDVEKKLCIDSKRSTHYISGDAPKRRRCNRKEWWRKKCKHSHTPLPQKAPFQKRPAIKFIVCFAKLMHNLGIMPVVKHFKYLKL
jgi:hypothetical protein